jgi:hypothetical protein
MGTAAQSVHDRQIMWIFLSALLALVVISILLVVLFLLCEEILRCYRAREITPPHDVQD